MSETNPTHHDGCLYFAANSLARHMNEIAEEAFKFTHITPSYGFVMLEILNDPGLSQSKLAKSMNLKASTITRFVDKLIEKGLVERVQEGRTSIVHPTKEGRDFKVIIEQALKILHDAYCDILGEDTAMDMTKEIQNINHQLKK